MTRTLFIASAVLAVFMVGGFVMSVTSSAMTGLMLSLLCFGPLFLLSLGGAIGRASNEFTIARKDRPAPASSVTTNSRLGQQRQREPLS